MANINFPATQAQKVTSLWNNSYALADEGGYFMANTTTVASGQAGGTGIATTTSVVDDAATASATHAQNVPVAHMWNTSSPASQSSKSIYLQYIKMILTAVPTSATNWNFAMRADSVNRFTSGGTQLVPINPNTIFPNTSIMLIQFGAVVTTSLPSGAQRVLARGQIQSTVPVVQDEWWFTFGDVSMPTGMIMTATTVKKLVIPCGPIVLGPGWGMTLEMWGTSNAAAPAWEAEFAWVERISGQ